MRKPIAALLFLCWLMPAGKAWAESPIVVSHTLTGYAVSRDAVVLNYTLSVKNTGTSCIPNLTLSPVPLFIIGKERATLNIGSLDQQAEVQVPFTITTPMLLGESALKSQPLFWAGECTDGSGNVVRFSTRSVEGGAF